MPGLDWRIYEILQTQPDSGTKILILIGFQWHETNFDWSPLIPSTFASLYYASSLDWPSRVYEVMGSVSNGSEP